MQNDDWKSTDTSIQFPTFQVWFQNRRTKWRKKHAAEMATAKRRQEEVEGVVAEGEDGCSDAETDGGSGSGGGGGETAAKRLRRELEQQYRHWEPPVGAAGVTRGHAGTRKKGKEGCERRRIRRGPGAARTQGFLAACSENNARVGSRMIAERVNGGAEKEREREKKGRRTYNIRECVSACLSSWFSRTLNAASQVMYGMSGKSLASSSGVRKYERRFKKFNRERSREYWCCVESILVEL